MKEKRFFALALLFIFGIAYDLLLVNCFLFLNRRDDDDHAFAFHLGHGFGLAEFQQGLREFEQHYLTLFLIHNRASLEQNVHLHLGAVLQEALGVVEFEIEIVLVGLRAEADFLDHDLGRLGFQFLLLPFLFVKKLLVVDNTAYRRVGVRRNLHQIQLPRLRHLQGFLDGADAGFDVFTNNPHHRRRDETVNPVFGFFLNRSSKRTVVSNGNSYDSVLLI